MQALELPLFSTLDLEPRINTVSKEVIPEKQPEQSYVNPQTLIENTLGSILNPSTEDGIILKTKKLLGETAKNMSDEQIECTVTEFQFLIDSWLDEFEMDMFNGMTLKEVLNNG